MFTQTQRNKNTRQILFTIHFNIPCTGSI